MRTQIQLTIVTALWLSCHVEAAMPTVPYSEHLVDGEFTLVYDPFDGGIEFEANGRMASTLEIISNSCIFTGVTPDLVLPPFDVHVPCKFFILKTDGFGNTDFGPIAAPGLTLDFLGEDLTTHGSVLPSSFGNANVTVVPEPNATYMLPVLFLLLVARPAARRNLDSSHPK